MIERSTDQKIFYYIIINKPEGLELSQRRKSFRYTAKKQLCVTTTSQRKAFPKFKWPVQGSHVTRRQSRARGGAQGKEKPRGVRRHSRIAASTRQIRLEHYRGDLSRGKRQLGGPDDASDFILISPVQCIRDYSDTNANEKNRVPHSRGRQRNAGFPGYTMHIGQVVLLAAHATSES